MPLANTSGSQLRGPYGAPPGPPPDNVEATVFTTLALPVYPGVVTVARTKYAPMALRMCPAFGGPVEGGTGGPRLRHPVDVPKHLPDLLFRPFDHAVLTRLLIPHTTPSFLRYEWSGSHR